MDWITNTEIWMALLTLTTLEIVLGIDNIVFISILASKLPAQKQAPARLLGLALAMLSRIGLLFSIVWVMSLTNPLFTLLTHEFSGRDIILFLGGLFLVAKSTREIHDRIESTQASTEGRSRKTPSFASVLLQIMILDIVFSLDSVITAVGMANELWIMVTAVVIAVVVMMLFSNWISTFIEENPAIKVLALAFLMMIGTVLIADGLGQHIQKGYVYSAMAFSVLVEILNVKMGTRLPGTPVAVHTEQKEKSTHS